MAVRRVSRRPKPRDTGLGSMRPLPIMPRSPSEILEPTRAPSRPRGSKRRREVRRFGRMLRFINGLFTASVVLLLVLGGGALWFESELDRAGPLKAPQNFVVRRGEGARDIAKRLEDNGVIGSQHMFVGKYVVQALGRMFGGEGVNLQAGEYLFEPGVSIREVTRIIAEGKTVLLSITIPEGLTSHQIVDRLNRFSSLSGQVTEIPPEGSLMPDTYRVSRNMERSKVLDMMREQMRRFLDDAWGKRPDGLPVKSPQEVVVLASIVEKETGRKDERTRVAGVFTNRLRKGMRLQSDPTILYGLDKGKVNWGRPIMRSEIGRKTEHNTYQIDGLPVTPICNPGRASIEAVLNPAATDELYFVADGTGGHIFSTTLKDHNAAVANWRKIEVDRQSRAKDAREKADGASQTPVGPAVLNVPGGTGKSSSAKAGPEAVDASSKGTGTQAPPPARKPPRKSAGQ